MMSRTPRQIFQDAGYSVRYCAGEADTAAIYAIEFDEFGDRAAPLDRITGLWKHYPDCFFVLTEGDTVIGNLRIWPVADDIADGFQEGIIGNAGLEFRLTTAEVKARKHARWSIGSLAIHKDYRLGRKSNPVPLLLAFALNEWADSGMVAYPVEIMTTANSAGGRNLMSRFGFVEERPAEQMVDGRSLYVKRAANKNELFSAFGNRGIASLTELLASSATQGSAGKMAE